MRGKLWGVLWLVIINIVASFSMHIANVRDLGDLVIISIIVGYFLLTIDVLKLIRRKKYESF